MSTNTLISPIKPLTTTYDRERLEDIGFMTCMTLVLLGNYSQTGHFGGPLAYTPYNIAIHLAGPELGGLRYDYRRPKHPFCDKFMLAGGHNVPTAYALWMIMGESLARKHSATGDSRYHVAPEVVMLPIDVLGFRRGAGALKTLLRDHDLEDHPLFEQAKLRGIRALAGHAETTDLTNDVNGGPSGLGIATAAGKAAFWDFLGAPDSLKVIAFEGEFAMTEGHAQELKTQALATQVGKRLRLLLSLNNAGIDDTLIGGVIDSKYRYSIVDQWTSYGWNVFTLDNGNDYDQIIAVLKTMEDWDAEDRRPMIVIGETVKGYWPTAVDGQIPGYGDQVVSYPSHPYAMKMNSEYFVALAETFEKHFGVEFEGIRQGPVTDQRERLIQFKTNIDVVMSLLDQNGLGDWLTDRLVEIGDSVRDDLPLRIDITRDPFLDERLLVKNLPVEPQKLIIKNPVSVSEEKEVNISLFKKAGEIAGTRRAISEIIKWMNYVTDNRFITFAADLSDSINVEKGSLWGHYNPVNNPAGTRVKAPIQEAGNVSSAIGLIGQTASLDPEKFAGVWALSGTYCAFTPLMYTPARVWSQQSQDSRFRMGVLNILAGHSGPETAADARTHFGIFAPQVWKLFPRGQVIHVNFWDYNDVAPGYFAAAEIAARSPRVSIIIIEVARPDFPVADRSKFANTDLKAAAKGLYVIRDFDPDKAKHGYVVVQGSNSTVNLVNILPRLEDEGVNVKIVAVVSEDLFDLQSDDYRQSVFPPEAKYDMMVVSTGTRRVWPVRDVGLLTDEYSLTSDWDNQWLTGGTEADVIAEARLDSESIFAGIKHFALEREQRLERQRDLLAAL
ncbi:hypothetical protein IID10_01530 [candidate division KSB1 bacterium]|nr:hypothetical protein [candidate division KSB1 bacterium]